MIKKTKMFTKPLTRALRYILIKPFFLAIGWSYLNDLSHTFLKRLKLLRSEIACQKLFIFYRYRPINNIVHFFCVSSHKNFIPKYLDNALTDFAETSRTSRQLLEETAPANDFGRTVPSAKIHCRK